MTFRFLCLLYMVAALLAAADTKAKPAKAAAPVLPKHGVKTPGVLIPAAGLKSDADVLLDSAPTAVAVADGVWFATATALRHLDAKTAKPASPAKDIAGIDTSCGGLVSAFSHLWTMSCGKQALVKADPKTGKVIASIGIGSTPSAPVALAASEDSVWILADGKTRLLRVDPVENKVVAESRLPAGCTGILSAESSLWIACPGEAKVIRIDPKTSLVEKRIDVPAEPYALTAGDGAVWVLCRKEGKVARLDPKSSKQTATVDLAVPNAAGALAFGEGSLWAVAPGFPIIRIRTETEKERVEQQFYGEGGGFLYAGGGAIWVAGTGSATVRKLDPRRIAATLAD